MQSSAPALSARQCWRALVYPTPGILECEEASRRICDGFERAGFEIAFPRRLVWLLKALNHLPYGLYFSLMNRAVKGR